MYPIIFKKPLQKFNIHDVAYVPYCHTHLHIYVVKCFYHKEGTSVNWEP